MTKAKLFNESEYKQRAQIIINKYEDFKIEIDDYNNTLIVLITQLDKSESFQDFHEVVNDIIKTERKLDQFLLKKFKGLSKHVKDLILSEVLDKSEFQPFVNVLRFNQIITDRILGNKERLSLKELNNELPAKKYADAVNFIQSIVALKPMTELIATKQSQFKEKLNNAVVMDDVNELERAIDKQDKDFQESYLTLINFPEDEETAGAVIKFLEKNQHVKSIMETFDFAESLTEDVLSAKVRLSISSANMART